MRAQRVVILAIALIAGLAAGTTPTGAAEWHEPPERQATDEFLGFRLGEEIRYVLERADGEPVDARTTWGVRLDDFDREQGVFGLTYEVIEFGPGGASARQRGGGEITSLATATLWVNAHGFPTRIRFTSQRVTTNGPLGYTIEYRYENRRLIKELEGSDKDQEAGLDAYDDVDPGGPAGMYAFLPVDAECVAPTTTDPPCRGREPVFANPGLLNVTMPALWESGTGSLGFLAMSPTGVIPDALLGGGNQAGAGSGFSVGGYNLLGGGGPNPFGDADDAFQRFTLSAEGEPIQLRVGGRSVDVWRLRTAPPLESAYVDGSGSIVRVDLPPDPATGDRYWIRRLRPSEY